MEQVMLSVSPIYVSPRLDQSAVDTALALKSGVASSRPTAPVPEPVKRAEPMALAVAKPQPMVLPSTVDMRFEFNALTQAWMVAMTDANSGDVVRKIDLKGFSRSANGSVHASGHWVDKVV